MQFDTIKYTISGRLQSLKYLNSEVHKSYQHDDLLPWCHLQTGLVMLNAAATVTASTENITAANELRMQVCATTELFNLWHARC